MNHLPLAEHAVSEAIAQALDDQEQTLRFLAAATGAGAESARRKYLDALEEGGATEARTRREYFDRYPIELLQNAHDACADTRIVGTARMVVTQHGLLVANEGHPFDERRIRSLVTQGLSEKVTNRSKRHTIGYKGVGFSSVFQLTDQPQIASRQGFAFSFDRDRAKRLVAETLGRKPRFVAARAFPFRISLDDFEPDSDTVARLLGSGVETVVRLPLDRHGADEVTELIQRSIGPEILLFMPALNELVCESPNGRTAWRRSGKRRRGIGRLVSITNDRGSKQTHLVATDHVRLRKAEAESLDDPAWADVRRLNLAVALPWDRGIDPKADEVPIHVYFPTRETTGRSILFHGDFYIETKRERVEMRGTAGVLNERLADRLAAMAARLAASVAKDFSHELLCCLSGKGRVSDFGEMLNEKLLEHLREVRLVRSAATAHPQRIERLSRITALERPDLARGLLAVISERRDLVLPQDDVGQAREMLSELEIDELDAKKLAARIEFSRDSKPGEVLALIERWLRELAAWEAEAAVGELRNRWVIFDTGGEWRLPSAVVGGSTGGPPLPLTLRRREAAPLRSILAKAFLRRLEIEPLSPQLAIKRLTDALQDGVFGVTPAQQREAFRFAEALWRHDPTLVRDAATDEIPVRARNARRRRHEWRPARTVYFGREWGSRAELLERVYGPLGQCEFLPGESLASERARADRIAFFRALGVVDEPRSVRLTGPLSGHVNRFYQWRALAEVQTAADCGMEHPRADRAVRGEVLDRLDELLERAEARGSAPLVELVASLRSPFGPPAELRCTHMDHRGKAKWRPTMGYQRWRLSTASWVPVTSDPLKRKSLPPSRVWTGAPSSRKRPILVPRLRGKTPAKRLEFVRWTSPSTEALTVALEDLRDGVPDLRLAAAQRTGRDLLTKLDAHPSLREVDAGFPIIATTRGEVVWSTKPLVADIPEVESLVDLAFIATTDWPRIAIRLGLVRASSVVQQQVRASHSPWGRPILTRATRARLLGLARRVPGTSRAASRVATLRERQTHELEVELRVDGAHVGTITPSFHLHQRLDSRGRLLDADLFLTPSSLDRRAALGSALATHLGVPEAAPQFTLCLLDAAQAVEATGLSQDEIASAEVALKRRRFEDESFDGEDELESHPDPSSSTTERQARGRGKSQRMSEPEESRYETAKPRRHRGRRSPRSRTGKPRKPARKRAPAVNSRDLVEDRSAEDQAIRHVVAYAERELGVRVADVQRLNRGWDLEFTHPDGTWQPVEVKGSKGRGPFVLTPNEVDKAQDHANYAVYFVFGQQSRDPRIARIERFRDYVKKEDLVAMSWTLPTWAELPHEEIAIRPTRS